MTHYPIANAFFCGFLMAACFVAALFFLRFWRQTRDRFFKAFALAFFMMGIERGILVALDVPDEVRSYVYVIRLIAFLVILAAIYDKNRARAE